MLVRPVATNKRAFYLMNTTQVGGESFLNWAEEENGDKYYDWQVGAQLYELVASSTNERKTWLDHINAARWLRCNIKSNYHSLRCRRVLSYKFHTLYHTYVCP